MVSGWRWVIPFFKFLYLHKLYASALVHGGCHAHKIVPNITKYPFNSLVRLKSSGRPIFVGDRILEVELLMLRIACDNLQILRLIRLRHHSASAASNTTAKSHSLIEQNDAGLVHEDRVVKE
jgi:hypothetical protein